MNTLEQLVTLTEGYKQQLLNGDLSQEEFRELIEDLNIFEHIKNQAEETERDQLCKAALATIMQTMGVLR